jgi:hypothetical protein
MAISSGVSGGLVGEAAGAVLRRKSKAAAQSASSAQTPKLRGEAYLAATDDELALISTKFGWTPRLNEVLVRVPRSEVSSIDLGGGFPTCPLTVSFANGDSWQLEVRRFGKRDAQQLVRVLGGSADSLNLSSSAG